MRILSSSALPVMTFEKAGKVTPAAKCHAYHICKQTLVLMQKHVQFISFSTYIVGIYCMFPMQVARYGGKEYFGSRF